MRERGGRRLDWLLAVLMGAAFLAARPGSAGSTDLYFDTCSLCPDSISIESRELSGCLLGETRPASTSGTIGVAGAIPWKAYTLLSVPEGNRADILAVSIYGRFTNMCSLPVKISIVEAVGPPGCLTPDPGRVVCPDVSFTLIAPSTNYTTFSLSFPLPNTCYFEGNVFVCVSFEAFGSCPNAGYPFLVHTTTAPCVPCHTYYSEPPTPTTLTDYCTVAPNNGNWMISVAADCNPTPIPPTGLAATLNCPPTATLQWTDNSSNETGFEIEMETNGSGTWVLQATAPANTVAWTSPTPLGYGSTYAFRVRACNLTYCSAYAISSPVTPAEPSVLLEGTVTATVIERVSNNTPRVEVLPGLRVLLVRGVNREPIMATEADEQGHYQLVANVRCDDELAVELANPDLQIEDRDQIEKSHCAFDMSATHVFAIPTEYPMDLRWPAEIDGVSGDGPNAYFWIERVWREYWRDQIGLGPADRLKLMVLVEVPRQVGKYYACTDGHLLYQFVLFGSKFPRYRSTVLHEFAHNVIRQKAGGRPLDQGPAGDQESYPEATSMEEGLADYFTASYANDPQIHAWNILGIATDLELRNISYGREMPACGGSYEFSGDPHVDGLALAGALWDWRNRLRDDRSVPTIQVDRAVFDLIDELAGDEPLDRKFVRLRELLSGTTLGLQYPTDLAVAFDNHNIGFPAGDNCQSRPQVTQGAAWVDESGRHSPISWASVAEATGYRVYARFFPRSAFGLGTGIVVADSITATSFEFVDPDTSYVPAFVVASLNSAGEEIGFSEETPAVTAVMGAPAVARPLLSVFPNPATSRLRIEFAEPVPAGARVEVFDVRGRVVRALQATGLLWVEWDGRTVDGREVDSGVYFIRLASGRTTVTARSVLVR